jgi:hypothetical protein
MTKQKWIILFGILIGVISLFLSFLKYFDWRITGLFIIFIAGILYIIRIEEQKQTVSKSIVESLTQLKKEIVESLKNREPRMFPGESLPSLMIIDEVINTVTLKGYIEFHVQNMGMKTENAGGIAVHYVTPGMHQCFLIFQSYERSMGSENNELQYLRVFHDNLEQVDDRDFVATWFDYIFPVIGNFSGSMTEKMMANTFTEGELSKECFYISNYKYLKAKNNKKLDRLRIYVER